MGYRTGACARLVATAQLVKLTETMSTRAWPLCRESVFKLLFMVTGFYCLSYQYFTVAWMKCSTIKAGNCRAK